MSDKTPQATFTVDVGILLCGTFRSALKEAQFKYGGFEFFEGDGWISRTFVVKGDADIVCQIEEQFRERFAEEDEEEDE